MANGDGQGSNNGGISTLIGDRFKFGVWGLLVIIGITFMAALTIMQYGPFELRQDENRDYQELRERRNEDQRVLSESIAGINQSLTDIKRAQAEEHDQVHDLTDQLKFSLPATQPEPETMRKER